MEREEMTLEQERKFVINCFDNYEKEGFAKTFYTPYTDYKDRIGQKFEVVRRITEEDVDLCVLPQWLIKFEDGEEIQSYPEEIIQTEIESVKQQIQTK